MVRNLLLNTSLVIGSLLLFLVVGEIGCRVFFPDPKLKYKNDPELLARFEPNQEGIIYLGDGSRSPKIRINELGMRGKNLNEASKRRILFLGDSFTFGSGVAEDKSFPALVEYAVGDYISVVNGGQPGYGIYQMEGLFRRLGPIIRPELVVVVIWEGLFLRQPLSEAEHENFLRRSTRLKKLKSISVLGTHVYRIYERLLLRFGAKKFVVTLNERKKASIPLQEQYHRAVKADEERLLKIGDMARSHGGRLVLVFWPRKGFVGADNTLMSSELTSMLKDFSKKNQIPFYSVQDTLEDYSSEKLLIPFDWHPTSLAHCLVAEKLVSSLQDLGYRTNKSFDCAV